MIEIDKKIDVVIWRLLENSKLAADGAYFEVDMNKLQEESELTKGQLGDFLTKLALQHGVIDSPYTTVKEMEEVGRTGLARLKINDRLMYRFLENTGRIADQKESSKKPHSQKYFDEAIEWLEKQDGIVVSKKQKDYVNSKYYTKKKTAGKKTVTKNVYLERVQRCKEEGVTPSREEDRAWAKENGYSIESVDNARKNHAPESWQAKGKRAK